jgi:hypothetical protein
LVDVAERFSAEDELVEEQHEAQEKERNGNSVLIAFGNQWRFTSSLSAAGSFFMCFAHGSVGGGLMPGTEGIEKRR